MISHIYIYISDVIEVCDIADQDKVHSRPLPLGVARGPGQGVELGGR